MIRTLTVLESIRENRVYHLHLSPESPLGECFDVLTEMRAYVSQRIQEAEQAQKEQEENKE